MTHWPVVSLDSLAARAADSFVDGPFGSDLKASEYVSDGVPVLRLQNIRRNAFVAEGFRHISVAKASELARHDYGPGDVVITKLGDPCGVACQVPLGEPRGIIVADIVRLRPDADRLDARYLVHFVNSSAGVLQVGRMAKGTTRPRVNLSDMKRLEIPVAPLVEQRRIAALLDKADAIRRKRQQAIRLADDLVQSCYLALVGPRSREYGGWPILRIEQLADPKAGSMRTGPFGSALRHSEFSEEGIAVLGIDNAVQNRFAWAERRFITTEKYAAMARYTVKPGDVIITIMGTTGRSAVVPDDVPVAISTKHLATITVARARVHPEFLSNAIHRDPSVVGQLQARNRGAIMSGLNLGLIRSLELRLPPLATQERFAAAVNSVRGLEARCQASCAKADDLFHSLVQDAFRGHSPARR